MNAGPASRSAPAAGWFVGVAGAGLVLGCAWLALPIFPLGQQGLTGFLTTAAPLEHPDAVVLLAGAPALRAPAAARDYRRANARFLLMTREKLAEADDPDGFASTRRSAAILARAGVPATAIVTLPFTANGTIFDAEATRYYALRTGLRRLLLVTSDFHSRRALMIFRRVFDGTPVALGMAPVASPARGTAEGRRNRLELVKLIYYWLRLGLPGEPGAVAGQGRAPL